MISRRILIILALCAAGLPGQNFETASVKRASHAAESDALAPQQDASRIQYQGVTLKSVLAFAYGVTPEQISGPKWLGEERFDIIATLPAGSAPNQIPVMLQHLLADQFAMKVHEENKNTSFFALVPAKGGVKMKNVEQPEISATVDLQSDNIQLKGYSMPAFAKFLSTSMGHPVVDETGLKGSYDITLYLSMEDIKTARIRVAIQQLGLQFENRKGEVKSIVVDSANKAPSQA